MMGLYELKEDCCGCGACVNACPKQCISMNVDEEGFFYPQIEMDSCVSCEICHRVCPIVKEKISTQNKEIFIEQENRNFKICIAINKNEEIRIDSSSGGFFSILAEYILSKNGVVFGCAMAEDCRTARHIKIETKKELYKLRGSKYLQSFIGDTYKLAKELLEKDRWVLFTGTPCQIEGLVTFLGRKYEKLVTMDFICHGVPSAKVWGKYVNFHEASSNQKVDKISFRNKKYGWKNFSLHIVFSNGTEYCKSMMEDLYLKAFLQNICLRPSCYACHFKKVNHVSDITVADAWGLEYVLPDVDDDKGTSLILVNSLQGDVIFNSILEDIQNRQVDFNMVEKYNPALFSSAKRHENKEMFFRKLDEMPFDKLVRRYVKPKFSLKRQIRYLLIKLGWLKFVRGIYVKVKNYFNKT